MNRIHTLFFIFGCLLAFQGKVEAQILQTFDFNGAAGNEATFPPNGQPANGFLSDIRRGSGIQPNAGVNAFSSVGFTTNLTIDTSQYYEFSIRANPNFQLSLDSIVMGQRRSNTGAKKCAVRTSLDNFASDLLVFDLPEDAFFHYDFKTTLGAAFKNIASTSTVAFRYYAYAAGGAAGTWRVDSIRIHGQITPSSVSNPGEFSWQTTTLTGVEGTEQFRPIILAPATTSTATVTVVKIGGNATIGDDFSVPIFDFSGIPFAAGETLKNLRFQLHTDALAEGSETIQLVLRTSSPNASIGADSILTITINDAGAPVEVGPPFTRTIAQVRGANTDGQADSVGRNVRVFGTVYGLNQRLTATTGGYQMFIRDSTDGIGIFKTTPLAGITALEEGDSIKIMGKIEVFHGLSQINPDSIVVLATGRTLKSASVITKLTESDEANLLQLNGVQLVDPALWIPNGSGFTVRVFKGLDTTDVRIDNDCPLFNAPAPTGTFDIVGMGSQFAPTLVVPFVGGYQLVPRKLSDIITSVTAAPIITFNPNTKTVSESAGSVSVTVTTTDAPTADITLSVGIKSSTATLGSDFTALSISTITFPAGSAASQTFNVNLVGDLLIEPTENIVLVIRQQTPSSEFTIGADSVFTLNISDDDGAVGEPYPFTRTIAEVRGANADGGADSIGHNVRLYGTVYGVNQRISSTGGGYQMYLRDATGGIGIFRTTPFNAITLSEGDSIKVMGKIEVFRGLSQINPDSMVVIATGNALKAPMLADKINEFLESDLVRLNGFQLVNPTAWTTGTGNGGFTVRIFKGLDTTDVRIDNDCPLYNEPAPTGLFDLIGMGSQFATTTVAPYLNGYQLIPRKVTDLIQGVISTPTFSFNPASRTVVESVGSAAVTIVTTQAPFTDITFSVSVKSSTATSGTDFTPLGISTITFPAGSSTSQTFNINVIGDGEIEPTENIVLVIRQITPDPDFSIGTDSIFTLNITDDDAPVVIEPYPFTRTISEVRGTNVNGGADSIGHNVRLYGTIYGVNQRLTSAGGGYQLYMRDATGGIGVFKLTPLTGIPALNEGDSIKVMGKIEVFRGLSQINPDSMVIIATGRPLKTPSVVTQLDEAKEADLVRFNNVTLVSPAAWTTGVGATGFSVQITDGTTITDVRIDNDCPLYSLPAPTGPFDLIGMGSQFATTTVAPFVGGYQLIPRIVGDLIPIVSTMPTFSFNPTFQNVLESAGIVTITVSTNLAPTANVVLNLSVKSATATSGSDFTPLAFPTLTFPAGSAASQTFTVNVLEDAEIETTENIVLVIRKQAPSSAFDIGTDSVFTLNIIDDDGSILEPYPFTRTIAEIRGNNTGGQADSVGHNVRLYGTVYGVNQRLTATTGGYQMFIRDATDGIGIFKTTPLTGIPVLNEGDSIRIMGKIEVFRGLSQINPDSLVILATGRPLKTPSIVTLLDEPKEADLVRFNNVTLVSPAAWTTGIGASGFTVQITDGTTITDVRIDNDCPLYNVLPPTGPFAIIGMGSQFSTTAAPFVGGYQLIPRMLTDLITSVGVDPLCSCETNLNLFPNPGSDQLVMETKMKTAFTYRISNTLGQVMWEKKGPEARETINTSSWATGIYTIRVATGKVLKWIKK